jgi:hypothetical protein
LVGLPEYSQQPDNSGVDNNEREALGKGKRSEEV